jgi:hypothetical protein
MVSPVSPINRMANDETSLRYLKNGIHQKKLMTPFDKDWLQVDSKLFKGICSCFGLNC